VEKACLPRGEPRYLFAYFLFPLFYLADRADRLDGCAASFSSLHQQTLEITPQLVILGLDPRIQ